MLRGVCEPVHCPEHVGCRSLGRCQEWRILQVPAGDPRSLSHRSRKTPSPARAPFMGKDERTEAQRG